MNTNSKHKYLEEKIYYYKKKEKKGGMCIFNCKNKNKNKIINFDNLKMSLNLEITELETKRDTNFFIIENDNINININININDINDEITNYITNNLDTTKLLDKDEFPKILAEIHVTFQTCSKIQNTISKNDINNIILDTVKIKKQQQNNLNIDGLITTLKI